MIAIVDYGAGNAASVKNALDFLGAPSKITSGPAEIESAEKIILPGVGSFGFMMDSIRSKGLDKSILKAASDGRPLLGICLGMQALFEKSEESKGVEGLGIFKGECVKFAKGKIPQVGWNKITPVGKGIFSEGYAYFVNSYYVVPEDKKIIAAKTDYFGGFACAVRQKNVTGVQFHIEKSGSFGLELLRRWLEC